MTADPWRVIRNQLIAFIVLQLLSSCSKQHVQLDVQPISKLSANQQQMTQSR